MTGPAAHPAASRHPAHMDPAQKAALRDRLARRFPLGRYVTEDAGGDEDFALWLALLDARLYRRTFVTHRDLSDRPYRDEYDAGTDPIDYADEVADDELDALI